MNRTFCVISMYQDYKWIDKCFGSLLNSTEPVEVIAVDDASRDGSAEKVEKEYPEVELIRLEKNSGYGIANNVGIKRALKQGAEYIFLLNLDAWIEPGTLSKLIAVSEKNSEFGILSPLQLNAKGDGLDTYFSSYLEPSKCPRIISDYFTGNTKNVYPAENVMSAAWLLRADIIKNVGLFDENLFVYGTDDNYVHRATYHGYKVGIVPDCRIYHAKDERTAADYPARVDPNKQKKRAVVNALNPNKGMGGKFAYHVRKSFSDIAVNLQKKEWKALSGNVVSLFSGLVYIARFHRKYKTVEA